MEIKCQDFLEKNDLFKDEIVNIRTRELLDQKVVVDRMHNNVYGESDFYLSNENHDLELFNAFIGGIYLGVMKVKELIEKFNEEKTNCFGLDIFDKIGCDSENFDKAFTKQLKKCL